MRFEFNPKDRLVPFIGVCWWDGEVIISLWPLVWRFGRSRTLAGWRRVDGIDGYMKKET